jgi:hypothetical protein
MLLCFKPPPTPHPPSLSLFRSLTQPASHTNGLLSFYVAEWTFEVARRHQESESLVSRCYWDCGYVRTGPFSPDLRCDYGCVFVETQPYLFLSCGCSVADLWLSLNFRYVVGAFRMVLGCEISTTARAGSICCGRV